jgi:hypothetical protein
MHRILFAKLSESICDGGTGSVVRFLIIYLVLIFGIDYDYCSCYYYYY